MVGRWNERKSLDLELAFVVFLFRVAMQGLYAGTMEKRRRRPGR